MSLALVLLAVLLVLAIGSMPVFALVAWRRDLDVDRRGTRFLLGAGEFLVHWFMWSVGPMERIALRLGLTADVFNLGGLLAGLLAGLGIARGWLALGGWFIVLGGVCDVLDGRIARAQQRASRYGTFIDSTLDRFVEVFIFLGFVVYLGAVPHGPLLASSALAGSLLVSYTRARGESQGVLCKEGLMQRAERMVLTILACFLDPFLAQRGVVAAGRIVWWALALIASGTLLTSLYRTLWIARRLREIDRAKRG